MWEGCNVRLAWLVEKWRQIFKLATCQRISSTNGMLITNNCSKMLQRLQCHMKRAHCQVCMVSWNVNAPIKRSSWQQICTTNGMLITNNRSKMLQRLQFHVRRALCQVCMVIWKVNANIRAYCTKRSFSFKSEFCRIASKVQGEFTCR